CAQEPRVATPEGTPPRLVAELRLTHDRRDTDHARRGADVGVYYGELRPIPRSQSARRAPMREKRNARREFLRNGAALAGGLTLRAAAPALGQQAPAQPPMIRGERQGEIAYGARSKYVTSARIPHGGRPSPDNFGLTFHVATPLQDQVGVITPSSLHYYAT